MNRSKLWRRKKIRTKPVKSRAGWKKASGKAHKKSHSEERKEPYDALKQNRTTSNKNRVNSGKIKKPWKETTRREGTLRSVKKNTVIKDDSLVEEDLSQIPEKKCSWQKGAILSTKKIKTTKKKSWVDDNLTKSPKQKCFEEKGIVWNTKKNRTTKKRRVEEDLSKFPKKDYAKEKVNSHVFVKHVCLYYGESPRTPPLEGTSLHRRNKVWRDPGGSWAYLWPVYHLSEITLRKSDRFSYGESPRTPPLEGTSLHRRNNSVERPWGILSLFTTCLWLCVKSLCQSRCHTWPTL